MMECVGYWPVSMESLSITGDHDESLIQFVRSSTDLSQQTVARTAYMIFIIQSSWSFLMVFLVSFGQSVTFNFLPPLVSYLLWIDQNF